jgi:uncharacterized protein (TIGR02145 family)
MKYSITSEKNSDYSAGGNQSSPRYRAANKWTITLALAFCLMALTTVAPANNIQIENITLTGQNTAEGYWLIQFDLSWENSWRTDNLFPDDGHDVGNWDAAWVFVKYRVGQGEWRHVKLHSNGHSAGSGTPATLDIGLPDERSAFDMAENPAVGVFIYRSEIGNGTFSVTGAQLRWNYGVDEVPDLTDLEIKVFAVEMVYVPPGPFWLGSGGNEDGRFITGGTDNQPFYVSGVWDKSIENVQGSLWGVSASGNSTIGEVGKLNANFPTGLLGFYSMKYELSQQQYVDFLNTLPSDVAAARAPGISGASRNEIRHTEGGYVTNHPYVANNYLSWIDGAAFLDWAGLRPMTELEFEKAARGPAASVVNEYAWGTSGVSDGVYSLSGAGTSQETISGNYSSAEGVGNAVYNATGTAVDGPLRVGIFATQNSSRTQAGGSYWGVMELSGNLWELVVTVGNTDGRQFSGLHGDGLHSGSGYGDVQFWPGLGNSGITESTGTGLRGGALLETPGLLRVSDRSNAALAAGVRNNIDGLRGVRSVPAGSVSFELTTAVTGSGTVSPAGGSFEPGSVVQLSATAAEGYFFNGWTGSVSGVQNPIELAMDADKSITAIFEIWSRDTETTVVEVTNPATGRVWMDRNLGASRAATSSTDDQAYGDLYQWGRAADGHQKRTSPTTTTLSSGDQPGHGSFILDSFDWRSPRNDNLWQGVNGINNPCPVGYRLPTEAEWEAERDSWSSNNSAGAFASPLKLPLAGYRSLSSGSLFTVGSFGFYWSGSVSGTYARGLLFNSSNAFVSSNDRAVGVSVRCLSNEVVQTSLPTVSTSAVSSVTASAAVSGGNVTADGNAAVTARGVVWSTTQNPTVDSNSGITSNGSGTGSFDSSISGLTGTTTYYVRAYATNSVGTAYGSQQSFTTPLWDRDTETTVVDVTNPATGRVWMDRNLGASRAATSSTDDQAYGDLYQWGRAADGHQKRTSATTTTLSSGDQPGHGSFILDSFDWRSPRNDNLWQGVNGINNPCPVGYRLPTEVEWNAELGSWSSSNTSGAFASPLKLPSSGFRDFSTGSLRNVGSYGFYWSGSVSGTNARFLYFDSSLAYMLSHNRASGGSVRCLRDS